MRVGSSAITFTVNFVVSVGSVFYDAKFFLHGGWIISRPAQFFETLSDTKYSAIYGFFVNTKDCPTLVRYPEDMPDLLYIQDLDDE